MAYVHGLQDERFLKWLAQVGIDPKGRAMTRVTIESAVHDVCRMHIEYRKSDGESDCEHSVLQFSEEPVVV